MMDDSAGLLLCVQTILGVKGAIASKIKHAIKLAIKLKTYYSYNKQLQ